MAGSAAPQGSWQEAGSAPPRGSWQKAGSAPPRGSGQAAGLASPRGSWSGVGSASPRGSWSRVGSASPPLGNERGVGSAGPVQPQAGRGLLLSPPRELGRRRLVSTAAASQLSSAGELVYFQVCAMTSEGRAQDPVALPTLVSGEVHPSSGLWGIPPPRERVARGA